MKHLLFLGLLAFSCISPAKADPNLTRYGASAWCGARQRGASIEEANKQMRSAMSASMVMGSGNFAGQLVGLLNSRDAMQSSIDFHIQQMCPNLLYDNSGPSTTTPQVTDKSHSSYCTWNPWEEDCKDGGLKTAQPVASCLKALKKYDCRYIKYLEANPHMQDWADDNPEMARKEALRLKAVDADEIGKIEPSEKERSAADRATDYYPGQKKVDCLKAADYKGCMEYHGSN